MTGSPVERSAIAAALVALFAATIGAVLSDGEIEITLAMTTAVIAGLLLFDTSMGPRVDSFRPWAILSVAPALKVAPLVWLQIAASQDALVERYEHVGSLLFGACVLVAVLSLALPARSLGAFQAWYDRAAIAGASLTMAVAGASVAFLFDRGFGSTRFARLIETPTWAVVGALLAASALAASYPLRPSRPLVGVVASAAISIALLGYEVAGGSVDVGVWSFAFAGFAASTQLERPATLGARHDRRRRSNVSVIVLIIAGIVAAASAIVARGDRAAWSPGWMILGVVSLWLFGQAMASRPLTAADREVIRSTGGVPPEGEAADHPLAGDDSVLPVVPDAVPTSVPTTLSRSLIASQVSLREVRRAAAAKAAALDALAEASRERPQLRAVPDASDDVSAGSTDAIAVERDATSAPAAPGDPISAESDAGPALAVPGDVALSGGDSTTALVANAADATRPDEADAPHADASRDRFLNRLRDSTTAVVTGAEPTRGPATSNGDSARSDVTVAEALVEPEPTVESQPTVEPEPTVAVTPTAASATAQAAEVDGTNGSGRPATRAVGPDLSTVLAHHVDPSTGLLSGAGLQQALASAFALPVRAGDVAIMMITVRDLDHIEQTHGRLAAAAATSVVAERLRTVLPDGVISRFARSAYAVLLTSQDGEQPVDVDRLARALLYLREPLRAGSFEAPIDVVAGMAQCYQGEDAARFVLRANQGLARAVQTSEPKLVSMP